MHAHTFGARAGTSDAQAHPDASTSTSRRTHKHTQTAGWRHPIRPPGTSRQPPGSPHPAPARRRRRDPVLRPTSSWPRKRRPLRQISPGNALAPTAPTAHHHPAIPAGRAWARSGRAGPPPPNWDRCQARRARARAAAIRVRRRRRTTAARPADVPQRPTRPPRRPLLVA